MGGIWDDANTAMQDLGSELIRDAKLAECSSAKITPPQPLPTTVISAYMLDYRGLLE
jgi:hypothetical protein